MISAKWVFAWKTDEHMEHRPGEGEAGDTGV